MTEHTCDSEKLCIILKNIILERGFFEGRISMFFFLIITKSFKGL